MENLPTHSINLIFRFVSHPVADIIRPHIKHSSDVHIYIKTNKISHVKFSYNRDDLLYKMFVIHCLKTS